MEFHQLKGLVALAESRSFTRAAQMTHVVQSTLSQQIRSLEEELDVQLVVRTTRKVELTAAGKAAVEYAQKLLKLREEFICEMRKETAQQSGVIRIGTEQVVANYDLVTLLEGFRTAHPDIEVILRDAISGRALDTMIAQGDLDLCLINDIEGYPQLSGVALYRDELVAVTNKKHPLAEKKKIDWTDLADWQIIIPSSNEMLEKKILQRCRLCGFEPMIAYRTSNLQITADLLRKDYVSLNSCYAAKTHLRSKAIIHMKNPIGREISLAHRSGKMPSAAAVTFLKYVEAYRENGGQPENGQ